MSNLTTVVNSIVSKVNTHTTDLSNKATQISTHIPLSSIAPYHLLQGNLSVSASTITQGFNTTLYTGNGGTQSINTGIDMATQWGDDASERFGGLVWGKSRSGNSAHCLLDTIRGVSSTVFSNLTNANDTTANRLTAFSSSGFSVGTHGDLNTNTATYASWNFQTTHRITGTTNHGKAYTCHYNPFTGFTIVKYEGSGLAGHEIPHHLGRELGFTIIKNLTTTSNWNVRTSFSNYYLSLNGTYAWITDPLISKGNDSIFIASTNQDPNDALWNNNTSMYIAYGWANSYYDENKLIGNYEIGVYQGTGASGNKVKTRGKPAWIMIKRLDSAGNWCIFDNKRTPDQFLSANTSTPEADFSGNHSLFEINGFTLDADSGYINASGSQYLYMVAYDTKASDTANVQVNNALIPIAQGIDSNGAKNIILSKNETFSGVTYTQGKNYPYYDALGNRGVSNQAPNYGLTNPANGGDFYNVLSNKWFTSAGTEIANGRNYLNHIVYADNDGGVLYVEELPKVEYKDIVKANEFKGKNACTAWVNFDGTTTPPTIRDSFNVSSVVRTATGDFSIYFGVPMNNTNYNWIPSVNKPDIETYCTCGNTKTTTYCTIVARGVVNYISGYNGTEMSVQIFGGKN